MIDEVRREILTITLQLNRLATRLTTTPTITPAAVTETITAAAQLHPNPIPARNFYRHIQQQHPHLTQRDLPRLLHSAGYTRVKKEKGIFWIKPAVRTDAATPPSHSNVQPPMTDAAAGASPS